MASATGAGRSRATGACVHGPVSCDDGNACTLDFCDPASGVCEHGPLPGVVCDDGNPCTQADLCVQTPTGMACQGAPVSCDADDLCTADTCDPATGACVHGPVSYVSASS